MATTRNQQEPDNAAGNNKPLLQTTNEVVMNFEISAGSRAAEDN